MVREASSPVRRGNRCKSFIYSWIQEFSAWKRTGDPGTRPKGQARPTRRGFQVGKPSGA